MVSLSIHGTPFVLYFWCKKNFGDGVLVKDSTTDNVCYIDILSGLHFSNFGKKGDDSYDLREFLVREDNIEYKLED